LRAALDALPADYEATYRQISQMRHQFLAEMSAALEGRLNPHVQQLAQETLAEKQQIAMSVNRDLRLLNLCVRCPATGHPAILVADYRDNEDKTSRFRFQIAEASGRHLRKAASRRLPTLVIQECEPREEHFASRHAR
jgi:hypothetical protein